MGQKRGICRVLVRKPEGERPRCRWQEKIRKDLPKVGCGGMN
jgi:hypothetical protein